MRTTRYKLLDNFDQILSERLPVYSHGSAISAVCSAFLGVLGLAVTVTASIALYIYDDIGSAAIFLLLGPVLLLEASVLGSLGNSVVQPSTDDRPKRQRLNRREKGWLLGFFAFWLGLSVFKLVRGAEEISATLVKLPEYVVRSALLAVGSALLFELMWRLCAHAWRLVSHWSKPVFHAWTDADHSEANHNTDVFSDRLPRPVADNFEMTQAAAQTYATWSDERADQVLMYSQFMILVGGAVVGTGLPQLLDSQTNRTIAVTLIVVGLLLGMIGLRLSVTSVASWRKRATIYREHAKGAAK